MTTLKLREVLAAASILLTFPPLCMSQDRRGQRPQVSPEQLGCIEPHRNPSSVESLLEAYADLLARVARAESSTALALTTNPYDQGPTAVSARLATLLYHLDNAVQEYRCAGAMLYPFRAHADTLVRELVADSWGAFNAYQDWHHELRTDIVARVRNPNRDVVVDAERQASRRTRRDQLTQLLGLNAALLTYFLAPCATATAQQRSAFRGRLQSLAAGPASDASALARVLASWLAEHDHTCR